MEEPVAFVELAADGANAPSGAETHVSVLLFAGHRAYKFCKPVRLDFLDYSDVDKRRAALLTELACNRRFAPDVYLDVVTLVGSQGERGEPALVMRRMPDDRRFARLLGGAEAAELTRVVARHVATIHAGAPRPAAAAEAATVAAVRAHWEQNQRILEQHTATVLDPAAVARIDELFHRYLVGRDRLFDGRIAAGHAIDGHGDLLAEDIFCLPDGPRVLDCLAFDERLRHGDALLDAAFLAMDIERIAGAPLARDFLAAYGRYSGEHHPASLADHYIAYRAQVRCKVACIRFGQGDASAAGEAVDHLHRCGQHLEQGRVRLVLVGGAPGTGKTTVAQAISDRRGWVALRSDVVRKELAGLAPTDRAGGTLDTGLYDAGSTRATYAALLQRARVLLGLGETVVLDASWTDGQQRAAARALADELSADLVELRLDAPTVLARARVEARRTEGRDASDATAAVAEALCHRADPWPEAHTLDTSRPIDETLEAADRLLG